MSRCLLCLLLPLLLLGPSTLAQQAPEDPERSIPIGQRYIDTLPKSAYPRPTEGELYGRPETGTGAYFVQAFAKPSFRVGANCLERLCVIEASGPTMHPGPMEIVLRDGAGKERWRTRAWWVRGNQQMRAYWVPALVAGDSRFELEQSGEVRAQGPGALAEDAPAALFEVTATPERLAVDEGLGLMPWWQTLVQQGGELRISLGLALGCSGALELQARLEDARGRTWARQAGDFAPQESGYLYRFAVNCAGLRPGDYMLHLAARSGEQALAELEQRVRICPPRPTPAFGATYTSLSHPAPVYISRTETISWERLWQGHKQRDVVVSFPGQPYRFVFWRGTSYVPCWALPNAWLCYEWLEAEPDQYGAVDCVEPIMDKHCRYSNAEILESSPARVVVHWRYALTDLHCKVIRDEWADEYYYLYPDAIGTRKLVAWIQGWAWHENQEFIILNRPGGRPWQAVEPQAVTFMSSAGDLVMPVWPCPRFSIGMWPDYIARVNMRGQADPFQAVADESVQVKVWADPYTDKPGLLNSYLHWPVSHGIRTTWLEDPEDFRRPTHSNLVNVVHDTEVREEDYRIWSWLIGIAPGNARLRQVVKCWREPGEVRVEGEGLSFAGYDRMQRAYLLSATRGAREGRITLTPAEGAPVINPAFVIQGWGGEAHVTAPHALSVTTGRERDGQDLVIWLRGRFTEPLLLAVRQG